MSVTQLVILVEEELITLVGFSSNAIFARALLENKRVLKSNAEFKGHLKELSHHYHAIVQLIMFQFAVEMEILIHQHVSLSAVDSKTRK